MVFNQFLINIYKLQQIGTPKLLDNFRIECYFIKTMPCFKEKFVNILKKCRNYNKNLGPIMGEFLNNLKIQFPNFKIWNIIKQIFFSADHVVYLQVST